jgi:hypothetical protein
MKTRSLLLLTALTVAFTLPSPGQHKHGDTTSTGMKPHDMSGMMGTPTADATVEGLHMKVWLMTQQQHKEMMNGKMGQMMMHGEKEGAMGRMDKTTKDAMMAGTHHIMLDVTDAATRKDIAHAGARVLVLSPSKKNLSVTLTPMMTHFGGGLTLDEHGAYQITVDVTVGGVSRTTKFQYTVK